MGLQRIVAPSIEPVTLAEAKVWIEEFDTVHDGMLDFVIRAAREFAEGYCQRSFITQQWRLTLDALPPCVQLERGPVQAVNSLVYLDMAGGTQTITSPGAPTYAFDPSGTLARLAPGFGYTWPETLPQIGAVRITYTAGYGATADDVPFGVKQWMRARIATMFENREEIAVLQRGSVTPLPHVDRLLDEFRAVLA